MVKEKKITIKTGGMWEYESWDLIINCVVSSYGDGKPCKHCKEHPPEKRTNYEGKTYEIEQWLCPKVVVAENEGGFGSTGVCADCILETLNGLEKHLKKEQR